MVSILYVPPKQSLPVSKGGDLVIDFQQLINDVFVDYSLGIVVSLQVDVQLSGRPTPPLIILTATAEITGYHAVCKIEAEEADTIPNGSFWRCIVSYPTFPETTEVIGMNGRIKREDG